MQCALIRHHIWPSEQKYYNVNPIVPQTGGHLSLSEIMWGSIPGLMWVEFVVSSLLCSERFFSGYSGFPFSQKPTLLNSNLIRNARMFDTWAFGSGDRQPLLTLPSLNKLIWFCFFGSVLVSVFFELVSSSWSLHTKNDS